MILAITLITLIMFVTIYIIVYTTIKDNKNILEEKYDLSKLNHYTIGTFIRLVGIFKDISLDYLGGIQYEVLYSEEYKNYIIGIRHIKVPKKLYYIFLIKDYSRSGEKRYNIRVSNTLDDLKFYLDKIKTLDCIYKDIGDIKDIINKAIELETREIKQIEDYKNKTLEKKFKTVDIIYPKEEK